MDGLARWNEDHAAAASPRTPGAVEGPLLCYSGYLKHIINLKSQRLLGLPVVEDFTKPAVYMGTWNGSSDILMLHTVVLSSQL